MPSENQQSNNKDVRLIIDDAKTGENITDVVLIGTGIPDPMKWTELPDILNKKGKVVEASRDAMLDNVFRLKVDRSSN